MQWPAEHNIGHRDAALTPLASRSYFQCHPSSWRRTLHPTYQADPDVYKVVFEDQNLRVIAATWKKGATDKSHSHPVPSVIYALTDCALRVTAPDGTKRDVNSKAGSAMAVAITASHSAENVGDGLSGSICRAQVTFTTALAATAAEAPMTIVFAATDNHPLPSTSATGTDATTAAQ